MGILVSWINSWPRAGNQLTGHDGLATPRQSVRHRPLDAGGDDAPPLESSADQPTPHILAEAEQPAFVTTSILTLEIPAPPSPRGLAGASSPSFAAPTVGAVDSRHHLLVSSDYNTNERPITMAERPPSVHLSGAGRPAPSGSPPPPPSPGLRIDVAAANDPTMDHEMVDASFIAAAGAPNTSSDLCFDDEGLSALEKIYLFARSNASFHRVFISRSLASFLPDVSPCEAVEYVIPLMNGLAMDEDEAVREALVTDLVPSIWWFLTHCQIVDHEIPEGAEPSEVPLLNVQAFTPLLGTLLLNGSANVNAPARHCVVDFLTRIREADSGDVGRFGPEERKFFEHELIQHVVIGMAHLDNDSPAGEADESNILQLESATERSDTSSAELKSPPPSAADDEVLLSTLTSSVPALATSQFLAQEEPSTPTMAALAASIQRPPSPIPTITSMVPISEYEPDFAHIISRPTEDEFTDSGYTQGSPMNVVTPLPTWITEPMQNLQHEVAAREQVMQDVLQPRIESPSPERLPEADVPTLTEDTAQGNPVAGDASSDFNEEQAAIGKLVSMSLIAAVTASGSLDQEFQTAFVKEVERAGNDSVDWVRREATFALGALAKVVPEELLQLSLVPLFDCFCEDSVWNVRQSVLFALPAILSRLPSNSRRIRALQTIQKLAVDPLPQVRTGVLEVLGEVIYSFHEDDNGPPDEIIRLFVGEEGRDWHSPDSPVFQRFNNSETRIPWADSVFRSRFPAAADDAFGFARQSSTSSSTASLIDPTAESNPARPLICAFNLPAVTLTLGPTRWHELRGLYLFLADIGAPKVRQTLAASIGEVARIIGPENARRDLIYRWWDFVRGRDPMVRTKAIEALEVFLEVLDPADRTRVVMSLEEIWDNHLKGWREREVLARNLNRLTPLFPDNGEALRLLLRRALRDATAAVRNAAIEAYPQIYGALLSRPEALRLVTEEVSSLAYDESFKKRLTYVECVRSLITANGNYDRFMDESFWHSVVELASDKIVDVQIALARLLSIVCDKILSRQRTLPPVVLNVVQTLSQDSVADVQAFVSHILPPDLRPPTELVYRYVSESAHSMSTFSRPPPRREPRTLVSSINDMTISGVFHDEQQHHYPIASA